LTAELDLSNAQRDDYARRLEHEKEENREQNRMALLFLASKRVDPIVVQELKNMFATAESRSYPLLSHDLKEASFKAEKPRRRVNRSIDQIDNDSIISSVSTHREHRDSSNDEFDYSLPPRSRSMQLNSSGKSGHRSKSRSKQESQLHSLEEGEEHSHISYQSNPKTRSHTSQEGQKSSSRGNNNPTTSNSSHPHPLTTTPSMGSMKFGHKPKSADDNGQEMPAAQPTTTPSPVPSLQPNELLDQTANLLNWMVPGLWQSPSQS
jgi:hypothetical protein